MSRYDDLSDFLTSFQTSFPTGIRMDFRMNFLQNSVKRRCNGTGSTPENRVIMKDHAIRSFRGDVEAARGKQPPPARDMGGKAPRLSALRAAQIGQDATVVGDDNRINDCGFFLASGARRPGSHVDGDVSVTGSVPRNAQPR